MTSCWHQEPDDRPTFSSIRDELMKHIECDCYSTIVPSIQDDVRYIDV
jgi:hypothetical protein